MERFSLYTALFFFAVACSRGVEAPTSSSLTIRTPNHLVSGSGAGTMVALPAGRTACYGINILGAGPINGNSCGPTTGITAGYVTAGSTVSATVPSKQNMTIQLLLYLKQVGDSSPCPAFARIIPASQITDTYMVGEARDIYVDGADMGVTINGTFPGVAQNIAQTLSLPASCTSSSAMTPTLFSVSAGGMQTLTGAGFSMTARAGKATNTVLTSSGFKLIVR